MQTLRTSTSPSPGSGTSASVTWKSSGLGMPTGRLFRLTARLNMGLYS